MYTVLRGSANDILYLIVAGTLTATCQLTCTGSWHPLRAATGTAHIYMSMAVQLGDSLLPQVFRPFVSVGWSASASARYIFLTARPLISFPSFAIRCLCPVQNADFRSLIRAFSGDNTCVC